MAEIGSTDRSASPAVRLYPVGSTGVCPHCHRYASPAVRLYAELTNDQASWQDVAFWLVIGALLGAVAQVALERGLGGGLG